ncbi:hypothetical protein NPIL_655081 [Nephila pilipes]|uniref:Uncharacterized protein n=1 Tax=Nephila pilipes TaxID=299642 RepID=A0A8X6I5C4_NEPPI|nr:hypothetical protein NPIL_655081 [Nephila pilipes]
MSPSQHPADQDKTALVCPFGKYHFLRMTFGVKYAPTTFPKVIDLMNCQFLKTLGLYQLSRENASRRKHKADSTPRHHRRCL